MQTTGTPLDVPKQRLPACPTTFDAGKCGTSAYDTLVSPSSESANAPSPLPSTTPTRGAALGTRVLIARTVSSRRVPSGKEGEGCDMKRGKILAISRRIEPPRDSAP